ncbi:MAG: hypothetical protein M1837_003840 [Sclerophora amabilis]|nr:MAG: hypothetical protein M1837_003840 [Sclerophora amabilis]
MVVTSVRSASLFPVLKKILARCSSSHPQPASAEPAHQSSDAVLNRPGQSNHHDLPSFLDYALRVGLPTTSSTYVGTHFEYSVLHSLSRYAMTLTRVGGRGDHGIDLLGTWKPPSVPKQSLQVFVQCKVLGKRSGPGLIRELEGAFAGTPAAWKSPSVLGCLVASSLPTSSLRDAMQRCRAPMMFLTVERESGVVRAWMWNWAAKEVGLEGLGATLRYGAGDGKSKGGGEQESEIILSCGGEVLPPSGRGMGLSAIQLPRRTEQAN